MAKPQNHVTRGLDAALRDPSPITLPILDATAVRALEAFYPPRCLMRNEAVEDHLRYSGKVELVTGLRLRLNAAQEEAQEAEDAAAATAALNELLDGGDAEDAQRA